jgi:hypothetical protein
MRNICTLFSSAILLFGMSSVCNADGQGNPVDLAVLNSLNVEMGSEVDEDALASILDMEGAELESMTTPEAQCDMAINMLMAADIDPDMMTGIADGDDPSETLSEVMGDSEAAAILIAGLEETNADLDECFTNLATNE